MPSFKGSGDGYQNPSFEGNEGDRSPVKGKGKTVAGGKGGSVPGEYDNATAKTTTPQVDKTSRLSGGGKNRKDGYDNAQIEKDFGFSGHGKGGRKV